MARLVLLYCVVEAYFVISSFVFVFDSAASQLQLEQARNAIEHTVMSRVYLHALYPNGDADIYRDQ